MSDDRESLPDRVCGDHNLDVSGPRRIGYSSHSSEESRRRLAKLENEVSDIVDPVKRDDVLVAKQFGAIRLSNYLAIIFAVAHCVFAWFGKPFPLPGEFILLIATPYGAWTVERLMKFLRERNGSR